MLVGIVVVPLAWYLARMPVAGLTNNEQTGDAYENVYL